MSCCWMGCSCWKAAVKGSIGVGEEVDQVWNLFFSLEFRDVIHNLGICQIGYRDFVFRQDGFKLQPRKPGDLRGFSDCSQMGKVE